MADFLSSVQLRRALVAGIGGFLVVGLLAALDDLLRLTLLIAPFGASAVLVFAVPASHFAQPRNVIGGHLLCSVIGVAMFALLHQSPIAMGLGVGLAIGLMMLTDTVHPPAGADPIVAISIGAGWHFPIMPVLPGALAITVAALLYHRYLSRHPYPVPQTR